MKYLKIYTNFIQDMEQLTDAEKGRLFVMMLQYAAGEHPSPEGNERFVWGTARKQIDAQREAYLNKVESIEKARSKRSNNSEINMENSEIILKSREEQEQEQEQEQKQEYEHKQEHKQEQKEKKRTGFLTPTLNDIKNYCEERKNQVDYERFWNYYNDRNWETRNGLPLDWKEKVRQWEKSDTKSKPRNYGSENYEQKTIRMDELTNLI